MTFTGFKDNSDKQKYIWETYVLNGAGATLDGAGNVIVNASAPASAPALGLQAVAHVPEFDGNPSVVGTAGQRLTVPSGVRAVHWYFTSQSAAGGSGFEDGVQYFVTMGGDRGDPMQSYSIHDENSVWVSQPLIQAVDGAVIHVKVQREVA